MARMILAVIAGYIVMAVCIVALFSGLYVVLGSERSFQPGSYQASSVWIVLSMILGFVAAILGGWVALKIGPGTKPAKVLALLVVVLGVLMAIPSVTSKVDPGPRTGDVSNLAAMQKAQQPTWLTFLNPFIGAAGVLTATRRRRTSAA